MTGTKNPAASGTFVTLDAIDVDTGTAPAAPVYTVPQQPGTAIGLDGRASKIIVADYDLGGNHLQYSTSEIMTNATIAGRDVAVLYGDHGSDGETVLQLPVPAHRDVLRRRGDLHLGPGHRRPAAQLPAHRPDPGADQRRRPPAAPAARRHRDGQDVLAAGHLGRARCWSAAPTCCAAPPPTDRAWT